MQKQGRFVITLVFGFLLRSPKFQCLSGLGRSAILVCIGRTRSHPQIDCRFDPVGHRHGSNVESGGGLVLLGCGLRRCELGDVDFKHLPQREEQWAVVDLVGKGGHIRTVPVPEWVKPTIDLWVAALTRPTPTIAFAPRMALPVALARLWGSDFEPSPRLLYPCSLA